MKIDLIVISVILVTLVFLPFILFPYLQNSGNKKLNRKFREEAAKLNLNIDLKEKWNLNYIGIDSVQKKLLLVQRTDEQFQVEIVDLTKVKDSKVNITHFQGENHGKIETKLQRVDLEFTFHYTSEKQLVNLYDYDLNDNQDLEVKHAEIWNSNIKNHISSQRILKKTA